MTKKYANEFKYQVVDLICNKHASTSLTADSFNVPLKTVEKWVTAYNKDNNVYKPAQSKQHKNNPIYEQYLEVKKEMVTPEPENEILKRANAVLKSRAIKKS